jgi:hypothetical protein
MHQHIVESDLSINAGAEKSGQTRLFRIPDTSATSIHKEKRLSAGRRAEEVAKIVASDNVSPWMIWVETDYEADEMLKLVPDAVEVRGSMRAEVKEERLVGFSNGDIRVLLSKPSIAGFGLNWQHCNNLCFAGLNFSFEQFYQAIRRFWRFGQTKPVNAHVVMSEAERAIWTVVSRKAKDNETMQAEMRAAMLRASRKSKVFEDYHPTANVKLPPWLKEAAA